jgi:DNA-binding NarL/FixJ family response regulator
MEKRRILLISQPNLFRDSLEYTLSHLEDVQVTGCLPLDDQVLAACAEQPHDLVLIAEDQSTAHQASAVMSGLLEAYPNLPIIRVKLEPNVLLFYCPEQLPARVADLIKVIHQVPLSGMK